MVSLLRFSYANHSLEELFGKIRHFYYLHYLANNQECSAYLSTEQFKADVNSTLEHDRKAFDEPKGWNHKKIVESSPLLTNVDELWNILKLVYSKELSMLAYAKISEGKEIAKNFMQLIPKIIE
ncbi:MAG: hypothetical protein GY834_05900 [Bacteroidetes bacterium]|nr:hypothetical protein [Bacteroidota bacterium]